MLRSLKFISSLLLACGLQSAWAYSLLGPIGNGGDAWQVPVIGYGLPGDVGAPKNIGEEYRRNTPVMYYAYDQNFSGYFGLNGETAADGAFAIMNNAFTNTPAGNTNGVDGYSPSLSEVPLNSQAFNYTAQALGLTDLKSATLNLLVEQMGLAEPDRFVWTLHNRYLPSGGTCPADELYLVVQRNFDVLNSSLTQIQYSSYINDTLYSYLLLEDCTGANPIAVTEPFAVDPFAPIYTSVASFGLETGGFYGGLTRDDIGGLRYLLTTNNINYESAAAGSFQLTVTTNLNSPILFPANTNTPYGFGTYDLGALLSASQTNSLTNLFALYPGLIVASSSNYFILATNATVTSYYTNYIGQVYGTPPTLILVTNLSYYPLTIYVRTFANVVTNHYYPNTTITLLTSNVQLAIGQPAGTLVTNVTPQTIVLTNVPSGDFYLLGADQCPVDIISPFQTNVISTTNLVTVANTNAVTTTNTSGYFYSQSIVTSYKSYTYKAYPVNCAQIGNATGSYEGIEKITFVRVPDGDLDPLTGNFIQPITNNYTMVVMTNSQPRLQNFQRVITAPDFLMTAEDLAAGPADIPAVPYGARTAPLYNEANVLPNLAGPGSIDPGTTFTFDKVGDIFANGPGSPFLSEFTQQPLLAWGSFDGSTNAPVLYPNGTSIQNLENQIFVQITPTTVPGGTNGVAYPATTFTASGGAFATPFTWSQTGLPAGLTLSAGGTLSGTPTQSGTFDFTLQLTDAFARSVQWPYTIIIQ